MNNQKIEKHYLTTGECEKRTGIKSRKIAELCLGGEVEAKKSKSNHYSVCLESLLNWQERHLNYIQKPKFLGNPALAFGNLELDFETCFKPILSFNNADEIFQPYRNEYRCRYWVSNKGDVFDCDTGVYLKPDIKNTYYYVNLAKNTKDFEHNYNHVLVAYYFCKGWIVKEEVHHIDKNPLNNNYKNLIWVTHAEHMNLHHLLETDKKEYWKTIRKIQKENNKW